MLRCTEHHRLWQCIVHLSVILIRSYPAPAAAVRSYFFSHYNCRTQLFINYAPQHPIDGRGQRLGGVNVEQTEGSEHTVRSRSIRH